MQHVCRKDIEIYAFQEENFRNQKCRRMLTQNLSILASVQAAVCRTQLTVCSVDTVCTLRLSILGSAVAQSGPMACCRRQSVPTCAVATPLCTAHPPHQALWRKLPKNYSKQCDSKWLFCTPCQALLRTCATITVNHVTAKLPVAHHYSDVLPLSELQVLTYQVKQAGILHTGHKCAIYGIFSFISSVGSSLHNHAPLLVCNPLYLFSLFPTPQFHNSRSKLLKHDQCNSCKNQMQRLSYD